MRKTPRLPFRSFAGTLAFIMCAAGLLPGALLLPSSTFAQPSAPRTVACSVQYIYGHATCYAPPEVAMAERQARFAVRPSAAVYRIMRLRLAQVGIWKNPPVLRIEYSFGKLVPGGDYGRAPAEPKSVVVREDRGRTVIRPSRYVQQVGGIRMEISPAALNHPFRSYGPWVLTANFLHRNVTLSIIANTNQATLKQLALSILRS